MAEPKINTIHNTDISIHREYVIVCNEHPGNWPGCALFWGSLTQDYEKRSFGGYTTGVDRCEHYTMDEILAFSSAFSVYEPGMTYQEFLTHRDIIIRPGDLERLGLVPMEIYYRP